MRKYGAEFVGTFVLVFGGVGSAVLAGDKIGYLGVSFAFGLSLLAMAYAIGSISGCHINPAVTVGLLLGKKIGSSDAIGYIAAQIAGAILACGFLMVILGDRSGGAPASLAGASNGYGAHSPAGYGIVAAFLTETILTFFLVFTVLSATAPNAPTGFAGIPIGLALVLTHLVGIPVTNTSVNPARSIGTAVFTGGWALSQLWLFLVAPIVGAVIASLIFGAINQSPSQLDSAQSAVGREA